MKSVYTLFLTVFLTTILHQRVFSQQSSPCLNKDTTTFTTNDIPTHHHKTFQKTDIDTGVVTHRWYSNASPQNAPYQLLTDEGTRQYYLTTYGFEVFDLFPDYPRWTVKDPDIEQLREYKLRVADYMERNEQFRNFLEKRKEELSTTNK